MVAALNVDTSHEQSKLWGPKDKAALEEVRLAKLGVAGIVMDVHLERPTLLYIIRSSLVLSHFFERNNGEQVLGETGKSKTSLKCIVVQMYRSLGERCAGFSISSCYF